MGSQPWCTKVFSDFRETFRVDRASDSKLFVIHEESFRSDNSIDEPNSPILQRSKSSIDQVKHTEQCIQTEVTYPLDSTDLRQGCFLIDDDDDDDDDRNQSESSPAVVCIKKEDDIRTNKRNVSINLNPISIDCKLEIPKLEI
ncbi:unnamed protein product [Adineta steineri]|uniref:Uncharacterized protein n=1 Tax=Adineta steineri TaxID=433720 RepID=A0A814AAU3_9BILA|nr:unnamed protein product [Adineta steineri]CAF0842087.1 unnamed protein product [Adineta steineri]CAF0911516.1 unnamed protein product [Adineta steineri]